MGRGVLLNTADGDGSGEGAVLLLREKNHFWSSKSLVFCILSVIFVSSSTTDGLLCDDLSGSIAQGN